MTETEINSETKRFSTGTYSQVASPNNLRVGGVSVGQKIMVAQSSPQNICPTPPDLKPCNIFSHVLFPPR